MPRVKSPLHCVNGGVTKKTQKNASPVTSTSDECVICLEPISSRVTLLCKHTFCSKCIFKWIHVAKKTSCPCCRKTIDIGCIALIKLPYAAGRIKYFMNAMTHLSNEARYEFFVKCMMAYYKKLSSEYKINFEEDKMQAYVLNKFPRVSIPGTNTLWRVAFPWHKEQVPVDFMI